MSDYKLMYYSLFNDVTAAIVKLQQAQQKTERLYMTSGEPMLTALPHDTVEKESVILSGKEHPPAKDTLPKKKPPSHDER